MTAQSDYRALMEQALEAPDEGTADEAEATETDEVDTPDAQGDEEAADDEGSEGTEEPETADNESDGTGEDVPDEYFGVDLSGLSAEERASIIAGFQERDKFIQQLLRNQAEPEAKADEGTSDDEPATDDDLLKALGLDDPDDPYAENTAKVALPLAKMVLQLQETVEGLQQQTTVQATERYWTDSLNELESKFGALPVSRDELFKLAADAGVAEPVDAYWRVMGPARQQVLAEVQKRRDAETARLKKGTKGTVRPKDTASATEAPIKAKDVKDAMKQFRARFERERGTLPPGDDDD
jgi:hypothetical protein